MRGALVSVNNKSGGLEPIAYTVPRIGVKYNSTDYTTLTGSDSWSDTGTITPASKTIAIITIVPDTVSAAMNANLGCHLTPKESTLSRKLIIKEAATFDVLVFDWDTVFKSAIDAGGSLNTPPTPELRLGSVQGQAVTYDAVSGLIVEWTTANTVRMMNTSGTVIENNAIDSGGMVSGTCFYKYDTGDFYISQDSGASAKRFRKMSGVWTLQETTWYTCSEGITYDFTGGMIACHANQRTRSQEVDGLQCPMMIPNPILSMNTVAEGLAIDPKLRIGVSCSDQYWHGGIVGGNRVIVQDLYSCFQKYICIPDDIRFSECSGGSVSGQFNTEVLSASDWVELPIMYFGSHTGQQSIGNWIGLEYCDIEFRGSNIAPTTSVTNNLYSRPYYTEGWGATSPDSYSSEPSLFSYVQARIKPKEYIPATSWSPADVSPYIWSDMTRQVDKYGLDRMDFYADGGDAPVSNNFRVQLLGNRANNSNKWTQVSGTFRPLWDSVNKYITTTSTASNRHFILDNATLLTSLSACDVHVVMRRIVSGNNCIFLGLSDTATNNNKFILQWSASSAGFAHAISIDVTDGLGNRSWYGVADTSTTWKLVTFRLGVSPNQILVNGVPQTLTVNTGSNTGQCFDDVLANTARIARVQATTSLQGTQDCRFLLITPHLSGGDMTNLISYLTSRGII